jgi:hypothetical protein
MHAATSCHESVNKSLTISKVWQSEKKMRNESKDLRSRLILVQFNQSDEIQRKIRLVADFSADLSTGIVESFSLAPRLPRLQPYEGIAPTARHG